MKTLFVFLICLFSPVRPGKVEDFPIIINTLLKHFEIGVLDHTVFLNDKEEETLNYDNNLFGYHQMLQGLKTLNVFTHINYTKMDSHNTIHNSLQSLPDAPILFYISIPALKTLNGRFLQFLSTSDLSNHVWLLNIDSKNNCNQTMEEIQEWLKSSITNLNFDSQVALLIPQKHDCNNIDLYEVYKVRYIRDKSAK